MFNRYHEYNNFLLLRAYYYDNLNEKEEKEEEDLGKKITLGRPKTGTKFLLTLYYNISSPGAQKKLNSSLSFGQATLTFSFPGATSCSSFDWTLCPLCK